MIRQVRTHKSTATAVMKRAPFTRGFKDAQKGKSFEPEAYSTGNDQWDYERGRQLAFIFNGPLKDKSQLNVGALLAFVDAIQQKVII